MPQYNDNTQNRPGARDLILQFLADTNQPEKIQQLKKLNGRQFEKYVKDTIRLLMKDEQIIAEASALPIYYNDSVLIINQDEKDKREGIQELLKEEQAEVEGGFVTIEITDSFVAHIFEGQLAKRGVEIRKHSKLGNQSEGSEVYYYQLLNSEHKMLLTDNSLVTLYTTMVQINTLVLRSAVLNNNLLKKHEHIAKRFSDYSKEASIIYLIASLNHPQWVRSPINKYKLIRHLNLDLTKYETHLKRILSAVQGWKTLLEQMYKEYFYNTRISYELTLLVDLLLLKAEDFIQYFSSQMEQNNTDFQQCEQVMASLAQLPVNTSEPLTQAVTCYLQNILDTEEYFKQNAQRIPAMKTMLRDSSLKLENSLKGIQYVKSQFAAKYRPIYTKLQANLLEIKQTVLNIQQQYLELTERAKFLMQDMIGNKKLLGTLLNSTQIAPVERLYEYYIPSLKQDYQAFLKSSEVLFKDILNEINYHQTEVAKCLQTSDNSAARDVKSVQAMIGMKTSVETSQQKQQGGANEQSSVAPGMPY